MLARLYDLPETLETYRAVEEEGVILRRPQGYERHILAHWVGEHFSPKWVSEAKVAFSDGWFRVRVRVAHASLDVYPIFVYDLT
mgnify:CR=1 FL=1